MTESRDDTGGPTERLLSSLPLESAIARGIGAAAAASLVVYALRLEEVPLHHPPGLADLVGVARGLCVALGIFSGAALLLYPGRRESRMFQRGVAVLDIGVLLFLLIVLPPSLGFYRPVLHGGIVPMIFLLAFTIISLYFARPFRG